MPAASPSIVPSWRWLVFGAIAFVLGTAGWGVVPIHGTLEASTPNARFSIAVTDGVVVGTIGRVAARAGRDQYGGGVQFLLDAALRANHADPASQDALEAQRAELRRRLGEAAAYLPSALGRRADELWAGPPPPMIRETIRARAVGWPRPSFVGWAWSERGRGTTAVDGLIVTPVEDLVIPFLPLWGGILFNACVGVIVGGVCGMFLGAVRSVRRVSGGRCPECGHAIDPSLEHASSARPGATPSVGGAS